MGGEYRLVGEEEWQQLQSESEWLKAEAKRLESEGARLENEVYNLRWQYSHEDPNADEPSVGLECFCPRCCEEKADQPECKGEWVGDREWESEPRENSEHRFRMSSVKKIGEPFPPSGFDVLSEVCEAGPQRPHESLVWAMLMAALVSAVRLSPQGTILEVERIKDQTDILLNWWRERWPESED